MVDWKDKACIVTGACSGIGLEFVKSLLAREAKCLMADLNFKVGEEKEKEFQDQYGEDKVAYFRVDVSSHQNFEAAFEKCLELFGQVDVLVNSAGIIGELNWETQLQINLFGTIRGTKLALKYMKKKKSGIVLNLSSVHGLQVRPTMPTYSAGKSGIITFTRSIGHPIEYADHGVKIVCLCPGAVDTPLGDYKHHIGITPVAKAHYDQRVRAKLLPQLLPSEVSEAGLEIMEKSESASVWFIHTHGQKAFEIPNELDTVEKLLEYGPKN